MSLEDRRIIKDGRNRTPPLFHPDLGRHWEKKGDAVAQRELFGLGIEEYVRYMMSLGVNEADSREQFEGMHSGNVSRKEAANLLNLLGHIAQAVSHFKI